MKLTIKKRAEGRGREGGFTLIELLVVVFITAMISTISVVNFRTGERQKRITIAADIVVNAIRNAQNYTLAGREINDLSNPSCRKPVAYFTRITSVGVITLHGITSCNTVLLETYPLPSAVQIQANGLLINGANSGNTYLDIKFLSPFAVVTAGGSATALTSFTTASVVVESTQAAITKTITVDGVSGRIGE